MIITMTSDTALAAAIASPHRADGEAAAAVANAVPDVARIETMTDAPTNALPNMTDAPNQFVTTV